MRVCLIPTDSWGVGSYRCLFPGRELERRGHEVFAHVRPESVAPDEPLRVVYNFGRDGKPAAEMDADVYLFQRRMEHVSVAAIRQLRRCGKVVVGETDDNYDVLPASSPGHRMLVKHPDRFRVAWLNEGLSWCDAVTVSTPALADWYRRYNPNVHVLPNYLDWDMWKDVDPQYGVDRPRIRVGWMGWLAWRDNDLAVLREFMHDWLLDHPDVEFVSIGEKSNIGKTVHDFLRVPPAQRRTVPGRPFHQLAGIVPTIDIGLVPLGRNEFNECKSWLKGLEYSACGVVPVATPTEQYRALIRHGDNGFLADTADQWVATLDLLVSDHGLRRQVGANARAKAATMTIQKEAVRWERLYQSLLSERSTDSTTATSVSSNAVPALAG